MKGNHELNSSTKLNPCNFSGDGSLEEFGMGNQRWHPPGRPSGGQVGWGKRRGHPRSVPATTYTSSEPPTAKMQQTQTHTWTNPQKITHKLSRWVQSTSALGINEAHLSKLITQGEEIAKIHSQKWNWDFSLIYKLLWKTLSSPHELFRGGIFGQGQPPPENFDFLYLTENCCPPA